MRAHGCELRFSRASSCRAREAAAQPPGRTAAWVRQSKTLPRLFGLQWQSATARASAASEGSGVSVICKERADHHLHLPFVRVAIAGDRSLHFAWRITVHRQTLLRGGQQNHAAHFSQSQGRAHIQCGKDSFNCHNLRGKFIDQVAEQRVDILKHRARRIPFVA